MNSHDPTQCQICKQEDYKQFRHACIHKSIDQNAKLHDLYKITKWPRWDYQMEDATLIFSADSKPRVICEMEVAGSTKRDTWQWSWGNPNIPDGCKSRMRVVHELGTERGWDRLQTLFLPNDEYVGWECAGIANHLLGGLGVYRCPSSDSPRNDDLIDAVYVVILSAQFVA